MHQQFHETPFSKQGATLNQNSHVETGTQKITNTTTKGKLIKFALKNTDQFVYILYLQCKLRLGVRYNRWLLSHFRRRNH